MKSDAEKGIWMCTCCMVVNLAIVYCYNFGIRAEAVCLSSRRHLFLQVESTCSMPHLIRSHPSHPNSHARLSNACTVAVAIACLFIAPSLASPAVP